MMTLFHAFSYARTTQPFFPFTSTPHQLASVVVSHGNLTHNLAAIARELRTDPGTVEVSWLPQYHDMGLIGSYLGLLYCGACVRTGRGRGSDSHTAVSTTDSPLLTSTGGTGYYASPLSFIRNPLLWLHMLSTYRGTHTQVRRHANVPLFSLPRSRV